MLLNPFTPAEIASLPADFFGRTDELRQMERSLRQGSAVIQGPIGMGKSSLLARICSLMDGFESDHRCPSAVSVGHKGIQSEDHASRLVLESFARVDQANVGPIHLQHVLRLIRRTTRRGRSCPLKTQLFQILAVHISFNEANGVSTPIYSSIASGNRRIWSRASPCI